MTIKTKKKKKRERLYSLWLYLIQENHVASNHYCSIVLINYAIIISYAGMIVSIFSYLKIRLLFKNNAITVLWLLLPILTSVLFFSKGPIGKFQSVLLSLVVGGKKEIFWKQPFLSVLKLIFSMKMDGTGLYDAYTYEKGRTTRLEYVPNSLLSST